MATLLVSFDLKWENNQDAYNAIYSALTSAITKGLKPADFWSGTTSFYVVRGSENAETFARRVVRDGKFRPTKDQLLVFDANVKAAVVAGIADAAKIQALLGYPVKKV